MTEVIGTDVPKRISLDTSVAPDATKRELSNPVGRINRGLEMMYSGQGEIALE